MMQERVMQQPAQQPVAQPQPQPEQTLTEKQTAGLPGYKPGQESYNRMVVAGMHTLYDKKVSKNIVKLMASMGNDPPAAIAGATLKIMGMLKSKAKGAPEQVIIPAAMEIMMDVAELGMVSKAVEVNKEVMAAASQQLLQGLMDMYGVSKEQMAAKMQEAQGQPQTGQQPAPEQQPPAQPQRTGILNNAQRPV